MILAHPWTQPSGSTRSSQMPSEQPQCEGNTAASESHWPGLCADIGQCISVQGWFTAKSRAIRSLSITTGIQIVHSFWLHSLKVTRNLFSINSIAIVHANQSWFNRREQDLFFFYLPFSMSNLTIYYLYFVITCTVLFHLGLTSTNNRKPCIKQQAAWTRVAIVSWFVDALRQLCNLERV